MRIKSVLEDQFGKTFSIGDRVVIKLVAGVEINGTIMELFPQYIALEDCTMIKFDEISSIKLGGE